MTDPLANIFNPVFEQYAKCIGIEGTIENNTLLNTMYNVLNEVITKMFGGFALDLYKIFTALQELPTAIAEALLGNFDKLNKIINDNIVKPLESFSEIITDTKSWFVSNFLGFYDNLLIPLPDVELDLILFTITLPANKAYRELDENSSFKDFNPITIITFLQSFLSSSINTLLGYITDLIDPLNIIISLDLGNIDKAIAQLTEYFINLTVPLVNILNKFLGGMITVFNKTTEEIIEIKNQLLQLLLDAITGSLDLDIVPKELKTIFKFVYCLFSAINAILVSLFTFQFV